VAAIFVNRHIGSYVLVGECLPMVETVTDVLPA